MGRKNGFTLIELLVTIVVLSVMLALGVPSFMEFIKNNRVSAQTNDLVTAIHLARTEAVKRVSGAVICASTDQKTCSGDAADWKDGWIVFSDLDRQGDPDYGTEKCLSTEDCLVGVSTGLTNDNELDTTAPMLQFMPTGVLVQAETTFTLTSRDCAHKQSRLVTVTPMGQTRVSEQPCPTPP